MYYKIMLNASKSFVKKSFWTRNSLCIISRPKLSTSIYNLVLIYVCHIHHHFLLWQLFKFDHYRDTRASILDPCIQGISLLIDIRLMPIFFIEKQLVNGKVRADRRYQSCILSYELKHSYYLWLLLDVAGENSP